jgi:hypothetical protein
MTICQNCGEEVDPSKIVPRPDDSSRVVCTECADEITDALSDAEDARADLDDARDALDDANDARDALSDAETNPEL